MGGTSIFIFTKEIQNKRPLSMKKDLQNREDIIRLVDAFYDKVKKDEVIGYFFNSIEHTDWEKHLPVMYDFWENVLFYTGKYSGNPMEVHSRLHSKSPMNMQHFIHWTQLFKETADEMFEGQNTELIKQRAVSIATVMQIKIFK
jgi:hemoglobin